MALRIAPFAVSVTPAPPAPLATTAKSGSISGGKKSGAAAVPPKPTANGPAPAPAPATATGAGAGTLATVLATAQTVAAAASTSIPKNYQHEKTVWTRVWDALGHILTAPFRWLATMVTAVAKIVMSGLARGLDAIVEAPVWLFGKIFNVDTATARRILKTVIAVPFQAVAGVIRGVVEMPGVIVGSAWSTLRQLISLRWLTHGQPALQLLFTPIVGTVMTAIWPIGRGLTAIDDVLHPPRTVSDEERKILQQYGYSKASLADVRIHPQTSWLSRVMSGAAADFTLGTDVYTEKSSKPELLLHELVHRMQARDSAGGVPTFLTNYAANILSRLVVTGNPINAYYEEDQEVQAERLSQGAINEYEIQQELEALKKLIESWSISGA